MYFSKLDLAITSYDEMFLVTYTLIHRKVMLCESHCIVINIYVFFKLLSKLFSA